METSNSLLARLRADPNEEAWRRLDVIYRPLIRSWIVRDPTLQKDADDLVQEVMMVLVREIARFEPQRPGSFRAWLKGIVLHRILAHRRALQGRTRAMGAASDDGPLQQLHDPASDMSRQWDREHDQHVIRQLLDLATATFEPATLQAFHRVVFDGVSPSQVASELGISVNSVWLAKSRLLRWLRQEAAEIID